MYKTFSVLIFFILGICGSIKSQQFIFGHQGNKVFKADTTGNVYWVKNMSGQVSLNVPDSNAVTGVLYNKGKIYVTIEQKPFVQPWTPHTNCLSVISLDTSGNLINSFYWCVSTSGFIHKQNLIPINDGMLVQYQFVYGSIDLSEVIYKIDSTGAFDSTFKPVTFLGQGYGNVSRCYLSPHDSAVYIETDIISNSGGGAFMITALSYQGKYQWHKVYSSGSYLSNAYIIADSSKTLYTVNEWEDLSILHLMKMDSTGLPLISKTYSGIYIGTFGNPLQFINNELLVSVSNLWGDTAFAEISFDTLLNSDCITGTDVIPISGSWLPIDTLGNYPSTIQSTFTPSPDSITYTFNGNLLVPFPDYCNLLSSDNLSEENELRIYPNPARDKIKIESKIEKFNIAIRDLCGKIIWTSSSMFTGNGYLNVSFLESGIYYLTIYDAIHKETRKLLISN